jgi:hypothetical protein
MALPDRAYGERQELSPIRILGVIKDVSCRERQCRVLIQIESVERNRSSKALRNGDIITVLVVSAPSSAGDGPPHTLQAPAIGVPDNSVRIPPVASHTRAWLRPAEGATSKDPADLYELLAGPFGFGPNLED